MLNTTEAAQTISYDAPDDWTFRAANTKQVTHGIHPYPAMMIPQVARRLISTYGGKGDVLFDPYCGSGTTLLEGMKAGMDAAGTDLNPLARLIARVKTTPVAICDLDNEIARLPKYVSQKELPTPEVTNIDYWFAPETQYALSEIRHFIDGIANQQIADVFRVAFSLVVRKSSWTRKGEFKLYKMSDEQIAHHDVQPFELMFDALVAMRSSLMHLNREVPVSRFSPVIYDFNTVEGVPLSTIAPGSVDLVVTSPPYGDSRTTVAYGQFSRMSSQWLGYADASQIDNKLMGGRKSVALRNFGVTQLDAAIAQIKLADAERAHEVVSFFDDYHASIANVSSLLRRGGHVCYVVGNRTVKGCKVPTSDATAAFFEEYGFSTLAMPTRNIPNKRMPSVNSPSNIAGEIGETMTTEHIVICRKDM